MDDAGTGKLAPMMTDAEDRVWVRRNAYGQIEVATASKQPGDGWEPIPPDDPELLAFIELANRKYREAMKRFRGTSQRPDAMLHFITVTQDLDKPLN